MLMIVCTKVLRPGAPRIAKITRNFTLPRTVPVPQLAAGIIGAVLLLPVGLGSAAFGVPLGAGAVGGLAVGAMLGVGAVSWQPWKGESVARAAWVRADSLRKARRAVCPGAGTAADRDEHLGAFVCPVCGLAGRASRDGLVGTHDWRRRLFVGGVEVIADTGVVVVRPGSVPVGRLRGRM